MPKFEVLSREIAEQIQQARQGAITSPMAFDDGQVLRRHDLARDAATIWRPTFVHDIDKILHCPFYNRYTDKTQVFSLYKNDDLTRRSLHVQLVSRIARTIGAALQLNLDLIEAIALGHDIGHPPFAHTGETYLCELYHNHTGRYFFHNLQSVRVLDSIYPLNISLQTLNGIATHNGEIECEEYLPQPMASFEDFDRSMERCYTDLEYAKSIMPCTLEGSVVRLSDIISYLGKDRQDAARIKTADESLFMDDDIGSINAEIINNLCVNVIENSYGKPYIKLDDKHFKALQNIKGRFAAGSQSDCSHRCRNQLNGSRIQYHQSAKGIGCMMGGFWIHHPPGGLNTHGGSGVSQPQKIGADIGAQGTGKDPVLFGFREQPVEQGTEQSGQQSGDAAAFHHSPHSGPKTNGTCHADCQTDTSVRSFQYCRSQQVSTTGIHSGNHRHRCQTYPNTTY